MKRATAGATSLLNVAMVEAFRQRNTMSGNTPFMAFYGNGSNGSQTMFEDSATDVQISLVQNTAKIAEWGERGISSPVGVDARFFNGESANIVTRAFPIIKGFGTITARDTTFKTPTGAYLPMQDRMQIMRELGGEQGVNAALSHVMRHEYMASEGILTGKVTVNAAGGQFDFKRHTDNTFTVAKVWTDATSTPRKDMGTACRRTQLNGKAKPDACFMSNDMFDAWLVHPETTALADIRRYDITFVGSQGMAELGSDARYRRFIDAGWMPRAITSVEGGYRLVIFTTLATYTDKTGTEQDLMPASTSFVAATNGRFDRYFGPDDKMPGFYEKSAARAQELFGIAQTGAGLITAEAGELFDARMLKFFVTEAPDGGSVKIEAQSAPIYAPVQANAICVFKEP
jgi:hypothetical protein